MQSISPQEFVRKWKQSELRERASSQEHFIDLCRLIGHGTPAELDSKGEWFTFEAGAEKQRGGKGWADVWKRGYFAWEYKGKIANLEEAYRQLLQYREALNNPPLLVVSDMETIQINTNFTNSIKETITLTLDDLLEVRNVKILSDLFNEPNQFQSNITSEQVTEEAATEFARLADLLRTWGEDTHQTAHFLIRLLFCLFAEDSSLLPQGIFYRLVKETKRDYKAFHGQLEKLFAAMASGGMFGAERIPHFDGGLFENSIALELDGEGMEILLKVGSLD